MVPPAATQAVGAVAVRIYAAADPGLARDRRADRQMTAIKDPAAGTAYHLPRRVKDVYQWRQLVDGGGFMLGRTKRAAMTGGSLTAAMILVGALLSGCSRDKVELTQCEGGVAEIARISDVAPPNC